MEKEKKAQIQDESNDSRGARDTKQKFRSRKKAGYRKPERSERFNDEKWYFKYPALSEAASKIGFNHIAGTGYRDALRGKNIVAGQLNETVMLGLQYITTPGVCREDTSGYALQIRQLYLAMKRKYRGLNTYEPGDLGVTLFCIMEFYRYVAKLERIYGLCKYFSAKNRIIPNVISSVLHFNYSDIVNNLADFRTGINKLITKAASLCLPNGIDVLNRWFLLESNVFKDSENSRASYIFFDDMNLFYTYQPTVYSTGGAAVLCNVGKNWNTPGSGKYAELLETGHDMLDMLLQDDDITLQLGDIISYFTKPDGSTELLKLEWIPEDYMVVPTYNEDILLQVHNSTTGGAKAGTLWSNALLYDKTKFNAGSHGYFDLGYNIDADHPVALNQINSICRFEIAFGARIITRTVDGVDIPVYDFGFTADRNAFFVKPGNTLLDTWKDVPTERDVMEMTRLKIGIEDECAIFDTAAGTYAHLELVAAHGTEIVTGYSLYIWDPISHNLEAGLNTLYSSYPLSYSASFMKHVSYMDRIDWHPTFSRISPTSGNTVASVISMNEYFGDLDNARPIDVETLALIHDAAVLSEFKIESVSAFDQSAKILD